MQSKVKSGRWKEEDQHSKYGHVFQNKRQWKLREKFGLLQEVKYHKKIKLKMYFL